MLGKRKHLGRWLAIAVAIGLGCLGEAWAAKPVKPPPPEDPITYTLVGLSDSEGWASDVNQLDGGVEAVGMLRDNSGDVEILKAHYWMVDPAGNVVLSMDLQTLPPVLPEATVASGAEDVNNHGVVVGWQLEEADDFSRFRPLLWPYGAATPIELPLPEGASDARAMSINDEGIVVGIAGNVNDVSLVAWKVAVGDGSWIVHDTQIILTARHLGVAGVANSGYVAATVDESTDPAFTADRAYRLRLAWDAEQVWEVPSFRTPLFAGYSTASGVNEAGTVCGRYNCDGEVIAYAMTAAGTLLDLPHLPGGRIRGQAYEVDNDVASSLNNATPLQVIGFGAIVITATLDVREDVGILWNVGVGAVNLDAATSRDVYPYDINDAGWIVGDAVDPEDFLLRQPVVLIPSL